MNEFRAMQLMNIIAQNTRKVISPDKHVSYVIDDMSSLIDTIDNFYNNLTNKK